ncbi:hypothetical protein MUQ_10717, partial [Vibrio harveyi CAIM 1792]
NCHKHWNFVLYLTHDISSFVLTVQEQFFSVCRDPFIQKLAVLPIALVVRQKVLSDKSQEQGDCSIIQNVRKVL